MGEEEFENSLTSFMLYGPDGKGIEFDGLSTAEFVPEQEKDLKDSETYAAIKNTDTIEFTIEGIFTRAGYFMLVLGNNKRLIRRAFRWHEKLRRKGWPKYDLIETAVYKALSGGNNRKRKAFKTKILIV